MWEAGEVFWCYIKHDATRSPTHSKKKDASAANQKSGSLDSFVICRSMPQQICLLWKTNRANELLLCWIWLNLRPLEIVNDKCPKDLISFFFFEAGYRLPSQTYDSFQLRQSHEATRGKIKQVLHVQGEAGISLTSDMWTSQAAKAYNTTTCHLIDQD